MAKIICKGYANCIEYENKSYHKYLTIPVQIKTRGMKLSSSTYAKIELCVRYMCYRLTKLSVTM